MTEETSSTAQNQEENKENSLTQQSSPEPEKKISEAEESKTEPVQETQKASEKKKKKKKKKKAERLDKFSLCMALISGSLLFFWMYVVIPIPEKSLNPQLGAKVKNYLTEITNSSNSKYTINYLDSNNTGNAEPDQPHNAQQNNKQQSQDNRPDVQKPLKGKPGVPVYESSDAYEVQRDIYIEQYTYASEYLKKLKIDTSDIQSYASQAEKFKVDHKRQEETEAMQNAVNAASKKLLDYFEPKAKNKEMLKKAAERFKIGDFGYGIELCEDACK